MNKIIRPTETSLITSVAILFLIAMITLYSASYRPDGEITKNFAYQQMIWMGFGVLVLILIIWVGYERCIDYGYVLFWANILLLLLVLAVGSARLGARRWFNMGAFGFQPSEFCKVSFILALVKFVSDHYDSLHAKRVFFLSLIMTLLPVLLIIKQPDLGTALIFLPILCIVLFVAGIRKRYLFYLLLTAAISSPLLWHILRAYQKKRLLVFLNPNIDPLGAGYTIIQSKIAVGSGGFFGKGWLSGTQNQLNFLPERHTDFIFSIIGEEWGFFGSIVVIMVFLFIIRQLFTIASGTYDIRGRLLVVSIVTLFWFQSFVNIAMTIGLMPVVGLPLLFISYGGSSLVMAMALIGLAMSVSIRRKIF